MTEKSFIKIAYATLILGIIMVTLSHMINVQKLEAIAYVLLTFDVLILWIYPVNTKEK